MIDIVERLRRSAQERRMCHEAADEIERLHDIERILREELDKHHAEIERLRAALTSANHHAAERLIALREVEAELRDCQAALAGKEDRREANLCTCGAAGSGEEHEEWCDAALSGKGES